MSNKTNQVVNRNCSVNNQRCKIEVKFILRRSLNLFSHWKRYYKQRKQARADNHVHLLVFINKIEPFILNMKFITTKASEPTETGFADFIKGVRRIIRGVSSAKTEPFPHLNSLGSVLATRFTANHEG